MPGLMAIGTVNAPAELFGEVAQRKRIPHVELDLQVWLPPIGGERAFADDEPHNVADIEFPHAPKLACCSALEQRHVAHCAIPELAPSTNEPRGTYKKSPHARALL